jgi:hypothetical protein
VQQGSGNVGVGTSSPFTKFAVGGNAYIGGSITSTGAITAFADSTSIPELSIGTGGISGNFMSFSGGRAMFGYNPAVVGPDLGEALINAGTSKGIQFMVSGTSNTFVTGTNAMEINNNGNVGIGTTTPGSLLTVQGTLNLANSSTGAPVTFSSGSTGFLTVTSQGSQTFNAANGNSIVFDQSSSPVLSIANGGNVGIGTTTPGSILSIQSSTALIGLYDTSSNSNDTVSNAGGFLVFNTGAGNSILFEQAGSEIGRFNINHYFGIGTTTPGSLLSLNNIANFTTATSTFYGNGLNLTAGCFAIGGNCLSLSSLGGIVPISGGGTGTTTGGVTNALEYYDGTKLTNGPATIIPTLTGVVPTFQNNQTYAGILRLGDSFNNFLSNASFEFWLNGTSVAPNAWTTQGSLTVARSAAGNATTGQYSVVLNTTASDDKIYQDFTATSSVPYTLSLWVARTSGTGNASLIAQEEGGSFTEYVNVSCPTAATFSLCMATFTKPADGVNTVRFKFASESNTATTWQIDEAMLQEGDHLATAFLPAYIDDTNSQSIYGAKTFFSTTTAAGINLTSGCFSIAGTCIGSGSVTSVSATYPLSSTGGATPVISSATSSASSAGVLSAADWTTFNNKQSAISLTTTGTGAATFVSNVLNIPTPIIPAAANPTGSIGLTAVNGSATTFMRSDGAPALSQAIVPTWTGLHTFTAGWLSTASSTVIGNFTVSASTTTLNSTLMVATSSPVAFQVCDIFGTCGVTVNTASTTGPIFTVAATTSTNTNLITLFSVDQYGHLMASSTPAKPTVSSCGTGTPVVTTGSSDTVGSVTTGTGAPTACTITYGSPLQFAAIPFVTDTSGTVTAIDVTSYSTTGFTMTFAAGLTSIKIGWFTIQGAASL